MGWIAELSPKCFIYNQFKEVVDYNMVLFYLKSIFL